MPKKEPTSLFRAGIKGGLQKMHRKRKGIISKCKNSK
jgi:hypothetical protein